MTWVLASLLANLCIQVVEYLNHTADGSWLAVLPRTVPFIVLAQWGLFNSYSGAPSLFAAWVVFTVGNSVMRVVMVSTLLGGQVGSWPLVVAGVSGMIACAFAIKQGLA